MKSIYKNNSLYLVIQIKSQLITNPSILHEKWGHLSSFLTSLLPPPYLAEEGGERGLLILLLLFCGCEEPAVTFIFLSYLSVDVVNFSFHKFLTSLPNFTNQLVSTGAYIFFKKK